MKKKLFKIFYYAVLSVSFIFCISSFYFQITKYEFNASDVKSSIEELSSDKYEGRLAGSSGCDAACSFIESSFNNSLKNVHKDTINVSSPVRNKIKPYLAVVYKNRVLKEYTYGEDFKENMVNFDTSEAAFTNDDKVEILQHSIIITQNDKKYLFSVDTKHQFNFRSSFNTDSQYQFCVNITTEVYNGILDSLREGAEIRVGIPYSEMKNPSSNIIGTIKGKSSKKPPLILSAHYDHVGTDALGNIYRGAFDNASGTSFLMELSKTLSSYPKPDRDIIFVSLTGEEFGLLGSKDFVSKYKDRLNGALNFNFDMVGAAGTPVTFMLGSAEKPEEEKDSEDYSPEFIKNLQNACDENSTDYNIKYLDSSDHASFSEEGINAVTITHADTSKIHTALDTPDLIDCSALESMNQIVEQGILEYAYSPSVKLLYNKFFTFACIVFIFLLTACRKFFKL